MARLFIAVWVPEDVAADLTALHRKDARGVRFVAPENWHITLRFLGDAEPADVVDALAGLRVPPTTVVLGPAVDVLDERVIVVPVSGLDSLAADVNVRTRRLGTSPPRRRFVGHLTLARLKRDAQVPRTLGALFHAEFDLEEVTLVQSRLDARGARYEILETWASG